MESSIIIDVLPSLLVVFSLIWIAVILLTSNSRAQKSAKLPPGPYPFPVIGNILKLGQNPHLSLTELSKKYGPIMSLKLGSITTVVVSSPEMAKTILQTNDLACSSRIIPIAIEAYGHHKFSLTWLPVQNQWRRLRKICKEHIFSVSTLDRSRDLRKEKLEKLIGYVKECSATGQVVDIGEVAFTTSLNLLSATIFSKEFAAYNSSLSYEIKDAVWGVMKCVGKPNLSDYFPILKPIDPQGIVKECTIMFDKVLAILIGMIDDRLNSRLRGEKSDKSDLLEKLLDLNQMDKSELSRDELNHLVFDLLVAGSDTTSGTVEWAMTELLRYPEKMSRVKSEIIDVIGQKAQVQESDISNLPYLQAVVKETFRLHPVAPLLAPHKAISDIVINDYIIPLNAQIFVNVWAINRDHSIWPNADSFMPERFLGSDIDFRGRDFELLPFGSGRRICPAVPLAYRMAHLMLATFVHNFGWKLEEGVSPHEIDIRENFGLTLQKAVALKAIPTNLP